MTRIFDFVLNEILPCCFDGICQLSSKDSAVDSQPCSSPSSFRFPGLFSSIMNGVIVPWRQWSDSNGSGFLRCMFIIIAYSVSQYILASSSGSLDVVANSSELIKSFLNAVISIFLHFRELMVLVSRRGRVMRERTRQQSDQICLCPPQ